MRIAALSDPKRIDLEYIQDRLWHSTRAGPAIALKGWDSKVWGDPEHPEADVGDLMVIRSRAEEDPFTTWVAETLLSWVYREVWLRIVGRKVASEGMPLVDNAIILKATSIFTATVASLLPVASVVVLYCVQTMKIRLGLIATFTALFALSILLFTSAKKSDVFAATAA